MIWAKLSKTLPLQDAAPACQNCGSMDFTIQNGEQVSDCTRWREHDEHDQPTDVIIYLCDRCSNEVIEPHPRLYSRVEWNEVTPGAMGFCLGCEFFERLTCKHPDLKSNGGNGLEILIPKGTVMFWDSQDKNGKQTGRSFVVKPLGVYVNCLGRSVKQNAEDGQS